MTDRLRAAAEAALEAIETVLYDAFERRFPECCGHPQGNECCGNWSEARTPTDNRIMDVLSPVQRRLSDVLRAALAEPDVPATNFGNMEPVAYLYTYHGAEGWGDRLEFPGFRWQGLGYNHMPNNWRETPLYTAPPRREWRGLTLAEIREMRDDGVFRQSVEAIASDIEAALKEKNHD